MFVNFVRICNTGKNEYTLKLKGTKKCNLRFADFGVNTSVKAEMASVGNSESSICFIRIKSHFLSDKRHLIINFRLCGMHLASFLVNIS